MTDRFVTVPDSLELPAAVKVPVARLHDSTAAGRALLTGADAAAQRSSLGLGNAAGLDVGAVAGTVKAGDYQPSAADVTDSTAAGRALLKAADAAAQRSALGLGTAATTSAATYAARSNLQTFSVDVDVDEAIAVIGQTPVAITTYAGPPNSIVHPSVLFFPEGWQGWRYWMAYTPFNGGDSQLENPSIAVSNDGDTWTVPNGLINPIEPSPPGADYNADPCLCMSADGTRLLMVWKRTNVAQRETCLRTSTDGVTWTDRVVLFSNTFEDVSPALLWDGDIYRMWTIKHADTPNTLYLRTATTPEGPWSAPVACAVAFPAGVGMWHIDVKRVGQQYHAVVATEDIASGNKFHFGKSNDGLTWTFGSKTLMETMANPQNAFYKACIVPKMTAQGLAYDMWYSAYQGFILMRTTISFDRISKLRDINSGILAAFAGLVPWTFADSFDRTDTTAGLGTATSGHAWASVLGNVMGIASGKAYLPVAANSRSIVNIGASDFKAGITFSVLGTTSYLMFRYVDASNLWRVGQSSGLLVLQKIVGGTLMAIPTAGVIRAGDRLEVQCRGSDIRIYINGLQIFQVTDAANASGTVIGLNVDNATSRFDNLNVRTL